MAEEKAFLRPADLASRLGVTTNRIYQLIRAGVIPALRIGGALRIPTAAWEDWVEQQRKQAVVAASNSRKRDAQSHDAT